MTRTPLDTLEICEKLKKKGFTHKQATEVVGILKDRDDGYHENFVQKDQICAVLVAHIWGKAKAGLAIVALLVTITGGIIMICKGLNIDDVKKEIADKQPSSPFATLSPSAGSGSR